MKKPLALYQGQLRAIAAERAKLDFDFAQVLAEAFNDGHKPVDLLEFHFTAPTMEFDL
jgi:hypothetical protein